MRDFEGGADKSLYNQLVVQETPVYLLARDEDCENSFHSSADFVSALSVQFSSIVVFLDPCLRVVSVSMLTCISLPDEHVPGFVRLAYSSLRVASYAVRQVRLKECFCNICSQYAVPTHVSGMIIYILLYSSCTDTPMALTTI